MLVYLQLIETAEDKSKFEAIYKEYLNLLLYLANKRLHNQQDAEDAVHKVFVKIAERIKTIEPVSPKTKRFVVIMIENTVTDILRSRSKYVPHAFSDEGFLQVTTTPDVDASIVECILQLPEQQQTIIWLKYNDGYSLREIAKILGISLAWAQKLDQRAKKRLEELYRKAGGNL